MHDTSPFNPLDWRAAAIDCLVAAGAHDVQMSMTTSITFEWPVPHEARSIPIEIAQNDGGTLLVVSLHAWRVSVTPAHRRLVAIVSRGLPRRAGDGLRDVQWQYSDERQLNAPFSIDHFVYATDDWRAQLLASVACFATIFLALDPLLKAAADGVVHAGAAHVVMLRLAAQLSDEPLPIEIARLRAAFPAITMERFDDGVLRAVKIEGAPESVLLKLDDPLLADVDEATMYFDDDAVGRWIAGGRLPRPLRSVEVSNLDAERPELVCALLAPFKDCAVLSLHLDDEERFLDVDVALAVDGVVPVFAQLEVLEIDCDASETLEERLLDLLLSKPMPKLRRFALNSRRRSDSAVFLASILKRLPSTVTELGLWQPLPQWKALREALLSHEVLASLTAVGVHDDLDEIRDPRLIDKKLFGPSTNIANVAHDLHELGRDRDVIDMIGPLRWKSNDVDIHSHYASSLSELDPRAGARAWRVAVEMAPGNEIATHNLANQLMANGDIDEAQPFVVAAHEIAPENPWMLRCLAVIAKHRGDDKGAHRYASRFIQSATAAVVDAGDDVDSVARYELACAQMWAGLPDVALATLEEAVAAGLCGVTPRTDVEWLPLHDDLRWRRLFAR